MKLFPGRVLVCALALLPLGSCTTLSPVNQNLKEKPLSAAGPEAVAPQWRPLAVRGLDYFAGKSRRPRLEFRALRVDLAEPGLGIAVYPGETAPPEAAVPGVRVSSFVRRRGLLAGINAAPFSPVSGKEGTPLTVTGITIANGVLVSPPAPRYDALVFYFGGGAAIVSQADLTEPERRETIQNAVGGFFRILENGRLSGRLEAAEHPSAPRHPRSAAGLSADRRFLYLLAIDGRRPGSLGATEAETAAILRRLGASDGINLDGGGSTSLALRYPDNKVRPVNIPIHGGIPGRERAVASCLGISPEGGRP
jgi:hypothetical protein